MQINPAADLYHAGSLPLAASGPAYCKKHHHIICLTCAWVANSRTRAGKPA